MKTMVERNEVLVRYRVEGQSKRQISREMGISRDTVDKIVWEYERLCLDENGVCDMVALEALTGTKPKYATPQRACRVVTNEMKAVIRKCLDDNRVKRATGMSKLQMNNKDIHALLLEKGFDVSYPSVCNHVSRISAVMGPKPNPEIYIHREHPAGLECEFDWGEVPLVVGGERRKFQMAVFTMQHSNLRKAWLFPRQDTLALMEAHRNFFISVGGVPSVMVYDNMRVAVVIKTGSRGRPATKYPTKTMQRLSLHYRFKERFCNARSGWEKGSVERSVEVVRHEAFATRQSFETLEDAQLWLERTLERVNAVSGIVGISNCDKAARIKADLAALQPAQTPISCFEMEDHRPDKYCTVAVDSNNYSVPETYRNTVVSVKVFSSKLVMMVDGKNIATHTRLRGKGGWSMHLDHYLRTFLRKPGALDCSTALRQVPPEITELYRVHFCPDRQREFIEFMMYARDNGILHNQILASVRRLRMKGVRHITADHLKVDISAAIHPDNASSTAETLSNMLSIESASQLLQIEKHAQLTLSSLDSVMAHSSSHKFSIN